MKIRVVEIENLRGIEAIHFEPDKLVNVIVGPNPHLAWDDATVANQFCKNVGYSVG